MASHEPIALSWRGDMNETKYVFYKGRQQSQVHASLYVGRQALLTTTNDLFV